MGINYTDDFDGSTVDRDQTYQIQITKFESDSKMLKSKTFYVGLASLKKAMGDRDMGWQTWNKDPSDGKWKKQ